MNTLKPVADDVLKTAQKHDPHVRYAVNLLAEYDWLINGHFVGAAVRTTPDGSYIVWREAREAYNAGTFNLCSTSALAVLDFAIAIGENRYKLNIMGEHHADTMLATFAGALGIELARVPR